MSSNIIPLIILYISIKVGNKKINSLRDISYFIIANFDIKISRKLSIFC